MAAHFSRLHWFWLSSTGNYVRSCQVRNVICTHSADAALFFRLLAFFSRLHYRRDVMGWITKFMAVFLLSRVAWTVEQSSPGACRARRDLDSIWYDIFIGASLGQFGNIYTMWCDRGTEHTILISWTPRWTGFSLFSKPLEMYNRLQNDDLTGSMHLLWMCTEFVWPLFILPCIYVCPFVIFVLEFIKVC